MAAHLTEFYLDNIHLSIYEDAYLVKVVQSKKNPYRPNQLTDLPDWVFNSKNAIWLTEEPVPISIRADHGDLIRKRLREELNRLRNHPLSAA